MAEREVEDDSEDSTCNSHAAEIPCEIWIADDGRTGQTDDICESRGEEVDGGDQASHIHRSAGVSDTISRDVDEQFGDSSQSVGESGPPDGDGGDAFSDFTLACRAEFATWAEFVGVVVEDCVAYTSQGGHCETGGDACYGTVVDVEFSE